MKILLVHNRYRADAPSGENVVVDQEASLLSSRGHEISLFQRHSDEIAHWSSWKRARLPFRVIWSGESSRQMTAALNDFAPDIVHIHNTFPLITPSVLHACFESSTPVVVTLHNYKLGCASGDFFREGRVCHDCLTETSLSALSHRCYRDSRAATAPVVLSHWLNSRSWRTMVSAYLFISNAQRSRLEPLGFPAERSFVKHNFVLAPPFQAISTKEPVVAYVGRLDEAKGVPFLMRAWDAYRLRRPNSPLRLVIAGGGELSDVVGRWAAQHRTVTTEGRLSREGVFALLGRSRAAVVPSQWEETFGMVAVEAMAAGTAPIASAHGAFPELVTSGVNGVLFAPTDVNALVDLLADVDDNPQRWHKLGEQGRRTYVDRFGPAASIDQLLDIYRFATEHPLGPRLSPSVGSAGAS